MVFIGQIFVTFINRFYLVYVPYYYSLLITSNKLLWVLYHKHFQNHHLGLFKRFFPYRIKILIKKNAKLIKKKKKQN